MLWSAALSTAGGHVLHQELISLQRLSLAGAAVEFTQAVLVWQRGRAGVEWSGSARLKAAEGLPAPGDEVPLEAFSLDGRSITGRVRVTEPDHDQALAFVGAGSLIVEGREL
jgi:hypothetical protein